MSKTEIAPLFGLVLAGGKSTRMGRDKGTLNYHGRPHKDVLYEYAGEFCERTFFSIRQDQVEPELHGEYILDTDQFRGPFNGLLSAHKAFPQAAWLVIACDLPFLDNPTIRLLVDARDPSCMATALATHQSQLPEPLAAIWEPAALEAAQDYLPDADSSCPRKFLLQQEIKLVFPNSDDVLINANHPEDLEEVMKKIRSIRHE